MINEITYPIPVLGTSILIYRSKNGSSYIDTVMETVTKEEFELITKKRYKYNSPKYGLIHPDNCYIGEADFTKKSLIDAIEYFGDNHENGVWINSKFNYNTAEITTTDGVMKGYNTFNLSKIYKYKHCQIGKPKYIIIFKMLKK